MTDVWTTDRPDITALPITIDGARNLLAYSRESSDRLMGIFGQEDQIIAWAEAEGYEITGFARDNNISGSLNLGERDGFSALAVALAETNVAGIVVRHLDRIARSVPIMEEAIETLTGKFGLVSPLIT